MNKDELVDKVVDKTGFLKKQVKECLDSALDIITKTLKKGEKVHLVGFGGFRAQVRKGRKGINPRTGKEMKIKNVKVAKFRAGKRLKEAVR